MSRIAILRAGTPTLSGASGWDTSAVPSAGIVTSPTVQLRLFGYTAAQFDVSQFAMSGVVTPEYQKNAGVWTALPATISIVDLDTLAFRIRNVVAGESWTGALAVALPVRFRGAAPNFVLAGI